jgi:hypothetical protein
MKYTVEMGSFAVIYIPSFIKTGSGIQKLIGRDSQTHRQYGDCISLLSFLGYFPKVGLCDLHAVCVSVYLPYELLNA